MTGGFLEASTVKAFQWITLFLGVSAESSQTQLVNITAAQDNKELQEIPRNLESSLDALAAQSFVLA